MPRLIVFYFLALSFLVGQSPLWAQTTPPTPAVSPGLNLQPIDVRFSTLNGLSYYQGNDELQNDQDFKEVVKPLNDFETQRLLNRSESSQSLAGNFETAGLVGLMVGVAGLLTAFSSQQTPFWLTTAGGGILFDIGTLFGAEAQTTKFNAVQRYNRFAYGREQVLPQTPTDEKSLLPAAAPSVATTPNVTVAPDVKGQVNGQ